MDEQELLTLIRKVREIRSQIYFGQRIPTPEEEELMDRLAAIDVVGFLLSKLESRDVEIEALRKVAVYALQASRDWHKKSDKIEETIDCLEEALAELERMRGGK